MNVMIENVRWGQYNISFRNTNRIHVGMTRELSDKITSLGLQQNTRLILDLENIQFIDSAGFECLLSVFNESRQKGFDVEIRNITPEVKELITLLNLEQLFFQHQGRGATV